MKRRNNALLCAFGLLLMGCATNEKKPDTTPEKDTTSIVSEIETSELTEQDTEETPMTYNLIEDYAQLNTESKLYEAFDEANISKEEGWVAEGTVLVNYFILTNPSNGHVLRYYQAEDSEDFYLLETDYLIYNEDYVVSDTQRIESECGIYTGMSLDELVEFNNGEQVHFYGFGWDYGGNIIREESTPIGTCGAVPRLSYDYNNEVDGVNDILGDIEIDSDHPSTKKVAIYVDEISVELGEMDY